MDFVHFVPEQYYVERFCISLFQYASFLIAFPLFAYHLASHGFQDELIQNSDSTAVFQEQVVELFLTIPLYNLLTFFGFESFAEGNMLHFFPVDEEEHR